MHHAGDRSRHRNRPVADDAGVLDDVTLGIEVHVRRGRGRRFLAIVDEVGLAVRKADEHESSTAQVSCLGIHHRQGETHGNGGVHGVAA